jgi:hypothetical protein
MSVRVEHFPCGDPMCEEGPDCVAVHLIREPGDASLELAPWWRACAVDEPACGVPPRDHRVEELRTLAEERADGRDTRSGADEPRCAVCAERPCRGVQVALYDCEGVCVGSEWMECDEYAQFRAEREPA